jgi:hypothetical protein
MPAVSQCGSVQVHLGRRRGHVAVYGKRNKHREMPLNSTARDALTSYLQTLPHESTYRFPSRKRGDSGGGVGPVGERALIYIVSKYAEQAHVRDLSTHDLRLPPVVPRLCLSQRRRLQRTAGLDDSDGDRGVLPAAHFIDRSWAFPRSPGTGWHNVPGINSRVPASERLRRPRPAVQSPPPGEASGRTTPERRVILRSALTLEQSASAWRRGARQSPRRRRCESRTDTAATEAGRRSAR